MKRLSAIFLLCVFLASGSFSGARAFSILDELAALVDSQPSADAPETLAGFAALLEAHTDQLEESFEIPCSAEMQKLLFENCSIPGQEYISEIRGNTGMISYSYYQNRGSLEFVKCKYYEGKRIVHAWRQGTVSSLTAREQETLQTALRMTEGIRGTELEREKAVHDLLCEHVTYYTNASGGHQDFDCAVGAIMNGLADCDGYADAFYLLGSLVGLEVRYQHGDAVPDTDLAEDGSERNTQAGGHMWNLIRLDGKWVMVDVTWDDQEKDGIFYVYFNTGAAPEAKKHIWEPQVLTVSIEAMSLNDLRPAGLAWTEISSMDGLYTALRSEIGRRERICLRYPDSLDLHQRREELNLTLRSLGTEDYLWHFGANCVEIASISLYPHYRVCNTEAEALAWLEECAASGIRNFVLFFTPELSPAMFANDRAGIARLLNNSRLEDRSYSYSEECRRVIISDASWIAPLRTVTGREDLFNYLEQCLLRRDTEILCLLPASLDFSAVEDAVWEKIYSMGVSGFRWSLNDPRLRITEIEYYPEFRHVQSRQEIAGYLAECRRTRPQEIRIYCPADLYARLHADNSDGMFSLMKEAGLKNTTLSYNDAYHMFIISPPEW